MHARILGLSCLLVAFAAAGALAMSDGNYTTEEQGCSPTGNGAGPDGPEHGQDAGDDKCQAARLSVGTDDNEKVVRAGLDHEEPNHDDGFNGGHSPHHGTAWVGSPGEEIVEVHYGTGVQGAGGGDDSDDHDQPELEVSDPNPDNAEGIDPGTPGELHVYFGADDNLESGEHDGIPAEGCADADGCPDMNQDNSDLSNGPSDGGAIRVDVTPDTESPENNVDPENPNDVLPAAYVGTGAAVDGIAFNVGTRERQVYDGGQRGKVYTDDATSDDYKDEDDYCDYRNDDGCVRDVHGEQQDFWTRPGVNVYEDPDPQDSSLGFPGPDRNSHVGTGGVKILGVSVVDTDDVALNEPAAGVSACCAPAASGADAGKACTSDVATNLSSIPDREAIAGCREVDGDNCIGGAIFAVGVEGCAVVAGVPTVGGEEVTAEACTLAAVAACCAHGACD